MRTDYILLDDDLEIMVIPHKPGEPKWLTYDEVDELRLVFRRFPSMIHYYNEMGAWIDAQEQYMETAREVLCKSPD
jgi:hypothetical protein